MKKSDEFKKKCFQELLRMSKMQNDEFLKALKGDEFNLLTSARRIFLDEWYSDKAFFKRRKANLRAAEK